MGFPPVYNNRTTTLAASHTPGDGIISLAPGSGSFFGSTFPIRVTCVRASDSALVVFQINNRSIDNLNIGGAIEGTTDIALIAGDICEMRLTAGAVNEIIASIFYTTAAPTTETVGGVPAGSTFAGTAILDVIDQLLHAYQAPAFTSFTITGLATQEVGQTFSGSKTFTWGTSNSSNVAPNTISIDDVTNSVNLGSGMLNDGVQAISINVSHNLPATHVWSITGTNTESANFSTNMTLTWRWRMYYGPSASTTLNEAGIEGLASNGLSFGFAGTFSYAAGGYKYISFPDSFGGPVAFKDALTQLNVAMCDATDDPVYSNIQNGFNYALVSVTNTFGATTNYRVYRTKNILGGSIDIIVS